MNLNWNVVHPDLNTESKFNRDLAIHSFLLNIKKQIESVPHGLKMFRHLNILKTIIIGAM